MLRLDCDSPLPNKALQPTLDSELPSLPLRSPALSVAELGR